MNTSLPKPQSQLEQLHDDDEDIFATSLIDRYAARPVSLQNMSLATFAVTYNLIQSCNKERTNWWCHWCRRRNAEHRK